MIGGLVEEACHRLPPFSVPSRNGWTCSMVGRALAPMQGCSQAGTQPQHSASTQCGSEAAVNTWPCAQHAEWRMGPYVPAEGEPLWLPYGQLTQGS